MVTTLTRAEKLRVAVAFVIEGVGMIVQLLLVYLGAAYLLGDGDDADDHARLMLWAVIATVYLACTVFWLNIDVRLHSDDHRFVRRISATAIVRIFSTVVTFSSSVVGLVAATELILTRNTNQTFTLYELIAVWAMLSSWALFHWGYSRIYYSRYHKYEAERPLRFPGTERPRLIDFVYFSFTNGTSFAPSDVSVTTSRMRWTVVWHTTFSFFFNALIIVLTMNTIAGGFGGL